MQSWRVRLQHETVAEVLRTIFIFKKYQKLYSNTALEHIYIYIYIYILLIITGVQASGVIIDRLLRQCQCSSIK